MKIMRGDFVRRDNFSPMSRDAICSCAGDLKDEAAAPLVMLKG